MTDHPRIEDLRRRIQLDRASFAFSRVTGARASFGTRRLVGAGGGLEPVLHAAPGSLASVHPLVELNQCITVPGVETRPRRSTLDPVQARESVLAAARKGR